MVLLNYLTTRQSSHPPNESSVLFAEGGIVTRFIIIYYAPPVDFFVHPCQPKHEKYFIVIIYTAVALLLLFWLCDRKAPHLCVFPRQSRRNTFARGIYNK